MLLIYRAAIWLYGRLIWLASFFNRKAWLFNRGRKDFFKKTEAVRTDKKRVWFHCASLGEFEQARPLIESFNKDSHYILVSFFSPSGYEIRKNYGYADQVCYLPLDSPANARRWFRHFSPELIFFIKYEFWYYYIREAKRKNIPIYLVSAVFRKEQAFFKAYGRMFRKAVSWFNGIFVQDQKSLQLAQSLRQEAVYLSGDTRFDRVLKTRQQLKDFPFIEEFRASSKLLILGSSWEPEEKMAAKLLQESRGAFKLIVAPHDISATRIDSIKELFDARAALYSSIADYDLREMDVLIIDSIGMLSSLYAKADFALVGGGFGKKGLHNILEPAVFGIPVFFGPNTEKFYEAAELVESGGAFQVGSYEEFREMFMQLLNDPLAYKKAGQAAAEFCESRAGATDKILKTIYRS